MFQQSSDYLTKGVQVDIPFELQLFMWELYQPYARRA